MTAPRIVYVDEDGAARERFVADFGARFGLIAASPEEAPALVRAEPPAVIVTAQPLSQRGAIELLAAAKKRDATIVRVALTAYRDLDAVLAAVNQGLVARYVIAPWQRADVEQVLAWALEAHALGRQATALQRRLLQTERLVTLGQIAAALLHDLQQPLTNLSINVERLSEMSAALAAGRREAFDELRAELPELTHDLAASCNVLTAMTGGFRQFMKAEPSAQPGGVDPAPIVKYALGVCRETAVRARGRLVYEGPPSLPKVRIGGTELTQVLINVVANAAQALLARDKAGGRVVVGAVDRGATLELVVEDDGAGMTPDVLRQVGTPFFSTRPEGTGLGVSQCRRLVEGAGGTFAIESTPDQGTRVTVALQKA